MICAKCNKDVAKCRCPDAVERLRWLLSSDSPVVFDEDRWFELHRRMTELQGERELRNIGK